MELLPGREELFPSCPSLPRDFLGGTRQSRSQEEPSSSSHSQSAAVYLRLLKNIPCWCFNCQKKAISPPPNFSHFPLTFQSGMSTADAPGQGSPCHQQHVVEQGFSFWSMALDHLIPANPGSSCQPWDPRGDTDPPESRGDLQDPHTGAQLPPHRPNALPATSTFASQTSLQLHSDSLKGCTNNLEDSCDP